MKIQSICALLLLVVPTTAARSAEPITSLKTAVTTISTTKTVLSQATLDHKIATLANLIAQQQARINQLEQQLTDQGNAIEMQITDSEEIAGRVASMEQAFSFSNGVLMINFEAIEITTDRLSVSSPVFEVDAHLKVGGQLEATHIKTESIDSETYSAGVGNIW